MKKNRPIDTILQPFFTLIRRLFFTIMVIIIVTLTLLLLVIDDKAITHNAQHLSHNGIQALLDAVKSPHVKKQKTIRLSEGNLNTALNYLLNYYAHSTSSITIEKDDLYFKISFLINNRYMRKYLNINFKLAKRDAYPLINGLKIGKISIADFFAKQLLEGLINHTPLKEYYTLAANYIEDIKISPDLSLLIKYIEPSHINLKNKLSLNNRHVQAIIFYQQQITTIIARHNPKWRLSLAELLQPLFKHAYSRSTPREAIAENRAALIAISTYVNKSEIQALIPFDISPSTSRQYPASLYRRPDMARHFMASAVLAANGAASFANKLGEQKELNDAKKGSGFSFVDLAGDRAGLKFGKIAISSPKKARKLQINIAKIKDYTAFMPEVRDLPENMNAEQFSQKFGSVKSKRYKEMLQKIDARISKLPIYQ